MKNHCLLRAAACLVACGCLSGRSLAGITFLGGTGTGTVDGTGFRKSDGKPLTRFGNNVGFSISGVSGGGGTSGGLIDDVTGQVVATVQFQLKATISSLNATDTKMQFVQTAQASFPDPDHYGGSISAAVLIGMPQITIDIGSEFRRFDVTTTGTYGAITTLFGPSGGNAATYPSGSVLPPGVYTVPIGSLGVFASASITSTNGDGSATYVFTVPAPGSLMVLGAAAFACGGRRRGRMSSRASAA